MGPAETPSRNKHPFFCFHPYQGNCNLSQPFQSPTWCLQRLLPTPPHHLAVGSFNHNSLGFGCFFFFPGWLQLIKDLQQDVGITAKPGCRSAGAQSQRRERGLPPAWLPNRHSSCWEAVRAGALCWNKAPALAGSAGEWPAAHTDKHAHVKGRAVRTWDLWLTGLSAERKIPTALLFVPSPQAKQKGQGSGAPPPPDLSSRSSLSWRCLLIPWYLCQSLHHVELLLGILE